MVVSALNHHRHLPYVHIHCSFDIARPGDVDSMEVAFEDDVCCAPGRSSARRADSSLSPSLLIQLAL